MEDIQSENGTGTFRDDPKIQLSLIDKYVKVELIKSCSFEGFLNCFDPVTHSIILLVIQDDGFKSTLIPGHAILNIVEHTAPSNIEPPMSIKHTATPRDTTRKIQLMEWLKSNFLPVTTVEDRIIFGNVSILPPYGISDICTDSPMIAMQFKKLIENMPEDYKKDNL